MRFASLNEVYGDQFVAKQEEEPSKPVETSGVDAGETNFYPLPENPTLPKHEIPMSCKEYLHHLKSCLYCQQKLKKWLIPENKFWDINTMIIVVLLAFVVIFGVEKIIKLLKYLKTR